MKRINFNLGGLCWLIGFILISSFVIEAQKKPKPKTPVTQRDINKVDRTHSETPLQTAAENEDFDEVTRLLQKGAKVNVLDYGSQETALYKSVRHRYKTTDIRVVKALLQAGADPNIPTQTSADEGATPLIAAVIEDDVSIVKLLLENGANPDLTDERGYNAYMIAAEDKYAEKSALLKPLTKNLISPAEERRARAEKTGKFFKNTFAEIYYEQHGIKTGTPLFVLHGGPGFDHQYFLSNSAFDDLGKNRPVIFYDQRGAGNSSDLLKEKPASVADQIEDLENLRKYLGYGKIDLAGHSWGGFLAMAYAVKYPNNVAHLVIIDSMSPNYANTPVGLKDYYPDEYREMKEMEFAAGVGAGWRYPLEKQLRQSLVAYMKMLFRSPQKRDAFIAGSRQYTYNLRLNIQLNSSADEINLTEDLKKLRVPTLTIHGNWDRNISLSSSENLQEIIPKSQLVVFEESGHLPFYEEPEKFITVVQNFLK